MDKDIVFKAFVIMADQLAEEKLEKGQITVAFARMGVWDKDGDYAEPGFYGEQDVVMIPGHDWSHVPIGKGRTREQGDLAIAEIQMNLELQASKDWLSAIKFDLKVGKPLQEYSYGFKVLEGGSSVGERLGRQGRILQPREDGSPGSKIFEVSPVLVGAGVRTHTMAAKAAGKSFADESQAVLDAADGLVARVKALAAIREKEGRELSAPNKERLSALADSFQKYAEQMAVLIAPAPVAAPALDAAGAQARRELVRMARVRAGLAA